jgi:transcriptional regulator with XRE-family HTH domain
VKTEEYAAVAKSIHRKEYAALIAAVRDARVAAGLTQVQVSERLGRSQSFISDVETGKRRVDVMELRDIGGYTGQCGLGSGRAFAALQSIALFVERSAWRAFRRTSARDSG